MIKPSFRQAVHTVDMAVAAAAAADKVEATQLLAPAHSLMPLRAGSSRKSNEVIEIAGPTYKGELP